MEKYKFQAKSEEGLLEKALSELKLEEGEVLTKYYEEKGGLFSGKKYTIEVVKLSDIADLGIAMTGGGSLLRGLDMAIRAATGLPAFLVDNPMACVACGSGKMLSNIDKNKHVLQTMY